MIHYNVWFSFKEKVDLAIELEKVRKFLTDLQTHKKTHGFRLMKNRAENGKGKLSKYHALVEFENNAQFGLPFAEVKQIGIRSGAHGFMIENVEDFIVEVFEDV